MFRTIITHQLVPVAWEKAAKGRMIFSTMTQNADNFLHYSNIEWPKVKHYSIQLHKVTKKGLQLHYISVHPAYSPEGQDGFRAPVSYNTNMFRTIWLHDVGDKR